MGSEITYRMGVTACDTAQDESEVSKMSSSTPHISKAKIHKRKVELKRLHKIYSWRKMAKDIFGGEIKFGVLQRFASEPKYVPVDQNILRVLDLLPIPNPYRILPRWYKRTRSALDFFNTKREQIKSIAISSREQSATKNVIKRLIEKK